jgi:hypothetical protein
LTIAALFGALVVFSAIALQNLFVPDTANEDFSEATEEITRAPETTQETTALEETTALQGEGDLRRPPDGTLSYGGQEVKGQLGSYCWDYGNSSVCADLAGTVPPKRKTLTIPSGSEMVFRYGRKRSPHKVIAFVSPPLKSSPDTVSATELPVDSSLKVRGSGVKRTIPAELPPGEYVLNVGVLEQQGDVSYSFRIMVK